MPADPRFLFESFYGKLRERGFVIYPSKLTVADSFRIGCIGRLGEAEMRGALEAVRAVMNVLGVKSGAPAKLAATA
jgi:2-aminoethylphosphonate-pyruvate transaminase